MYGATVELDDAPLRALGIHRLEIPLQFLEAGGPANVYAIEDGDGRWTLFDTGIGTSDGLAALWGESAERGIDLKRVSRIVVSHGHLDHFGNAQVISEQSGARVFVHEADRAKVLGRHRFAQVLEAHRAYFLHALGVPVERFEAEVERARKSVDTIRYVDEARLSSIADGEVLRFKHFDAVVRHLPGHTPGLICLHAERERVLFADDHVLARVSPNPALDLSQGEGATKFRALSRYIEGARWVRDQDLRMILPGHGKAFSGHRELLDGLFEFYGTRQSKILAALRVMPQTAFGLMQSVFPRRDTSTRYFLMLSEVIANLEVMEDRGEVERVEGDVVRYRPVRP